MKIFRTSRHNFLDKCPSVGPNRSPSEPEYFFLISCSTLRRNWAGLLRFEARPTFPCCKPLRPTRL